MYTQRGEQIRQLYATRAWGENKFSAESGFLFLYCWQYNVFTTRWSGIGKTSVASRRCGETGLPADRRFWHKSCKKLERGGKGVGLEFLESTFQHVYKQRLAWMIRTGQKWRVVTSVPSEPVEKEQKKLLKGGPLLEKKNLVSFWTIFSHPLKFYAFLLKKIEFGINGLTL
jgi:hypothetical protein